MSDIIEYLENHPQLVALLGVVIPILAGAIAWMIRKPIAWIIGKLLPIGTSVRNGGEGDPAEVKSPGDLRLLWNELRGLVEPKVKELGIRFHPDSSGYRCYYPTKSKSPQEIKFYCAGQFEAATKKLGFEVCYMLHENPERRREFTIRVMARCEAQETKECVRNLVQDVLPPSRDLRSWQAWENIWTGESYVLQGLVQRDLDAMAQLIIDAVRSTYAVLAAVVAKENSRKNSGIHRAT